MSSSRSGPAISVVMPVHNALPYLDAAVESILGQSRQDFEFVIYDDASTDGSSERLEEWARRDTRIRLFRGERNLGPAASSNAVVRHASAPLLARMDADDISLPERLERQSEVLAKNPDVGLVGALCDVIDSKDRQLREPELWRLMRTSWFTPFPHGSMMFRRELFESIGGYRDEAAFWEDLDFVIRASAETRILVLACPLYRYRQTVSSTRIASDQERVENALDLRYRALGRLRSGQGYDDILAAGPSAGRIDPRVFVSLALLELWSDRRPSFVRRFLKRARLRADLATILSIAVLSWAKLGPGSVRRAINLRLRFSNARVVPRPGPDDSVEWKLPKLESPQAD